MFAMWLHLKHSNEVMIEYEPEWATDGDYVIDFAVHRPEYSKTDISGCPVVQTHVELIEYKPATPTVSYCAEKSMALRRIASRISDVPTVAVVTMNIYYGSVYTNDRGAFLCDGSDFHSCKLNWLGKHEKPIRDHRFDLESQVD
jgi:hypothetical protein